MSIFDKHKQAGQNMFMSSIQWLANFLAFAVAFGLTGPVYSRTVEKVADFAESHYEHISVELVTSGYGIFLFGCIYFVSRATLATALMFGAVAILMRFA